MANIETDELEALWNDFHGAINMTSAELSAWLRTQTAGEVTEELPEDSGTEQGRHVLAILQKRRTDLTEADVQAMRDVVDIVTTERGEGAADGPVIDDADSAWRHRLMRVGHDPLKPW